MPYTIKPNTRIQVDIGKKQARDLVDFYIAKKEKVIRDHQAIFDEVNEYNDLINELLRKLSAMDRDYSAEWPWNLKIQHFLRDKPEGLTAREITNSIAAIENITDEEIIKKMYASISPTLSSNVNTLYGRKSNERNEYAYFILK